MDRVHALDVDDLLGIGEFSARCGLSGKMLRSYAAAGLLVPAAIDRSSGYRYYSASQLDRARIIGLLRRAGISVAAIAEFLHDPSAAQIDRWDRDLAAELSGRHRALEEARDALTIGGGRTSPARSTRKEGARSMNLIFVAGSATDKGGREVNQDAVLICHDLFAVADGLGGHESGEVASRLALETLQSAYASNPSAEGLVDACQEANRMVWKHATAARQTMGTTLAAIGVTSDSDDAVVVHVGDSRVYRWREGELDQVTHDHSVIADLIRAGQLTEEEALTHPRRNVLTRALGVGPDVDVDITRIRFAPGDRFLLCTDGLFKELTPTDVQNGLYSTNEPEAAADDLVKSALRHDASDNVTALVVQVALQPSAGQA
jgi:protein phosphatase